jgi:hypothetical protein
MIMKDVNLDKTRLLYLVECDEDIYDIKTFAEISAELKEELRQNLSDPMFKHMCKALAKSGRSITYRYRGNVSHRYVDITFTSEELEQIEYKF